MTDCPRDKEMSIDSFRVTSIPYESEQYIVFTGVPIVSNANIKQKAKYLVSVGIHPQRLPILPACGQIWSVKGVMQTKDLMVNGYKVEEHFFADAELTCKLPETKQQFVDFVTGNPEFKGIGIKKSAELWDRFGVSIFELLDVESETNKNKVSSVLSSRSVEKLFSAYKCYSYLSTANWLSLKKVPTFVQSRLFNYYAKGAFDAINQDPYCLLIFGMPFEEVDQFSKAEFQISDTDERRLYSAIDAAMQKEVRKGHTVISRSNVLKQLNRILKNRECCRLAMQLADDKYRFILDEKAKSYFPSAQLVMESTVAKRLLYLFHKKYENVEKIHAAFDESSGLLPYRMTEKQQEAVLSSLSSGASCITGGPGTGKTTVLKVVIGAYQRLGYSVHALALSGRAAVRLRDIAGTKTMTIAAFLQQKSILNGNSVVVIDEASMIDLPTMFKIITHCCPEVRFLLVGDPEQLPPIAEGKILSDIVQSKVITNTTLDVVQRQEMSTGIPLFSHQICMGSLPSVESGGKVYIHNVCTSGELVEKCKDLYVCSPTNSRVIAPTREVTKEINNQVQSSLNPDGTPIQFERGMDLFYSELRQGDEILFTKNNYACGVQNGVLGRVTSVDKDEHKLATVTLDDGHKVNVDKDILNQLELGYAITLHKAQGSQFNRVIIAVSKSRILDRAWLYTAITRAEAEVHIVTNQNVFKSAILAPSHTNKRNTNLRSLLQKY